MKFDVLNRFTGEIKFTADIDCEASAPASFKLGLAVAWALKHDADLRGADLRRADLQDAELQYVDLQYADLRGADLRCADLRHADLRHADLRCADLRCADLRCADLRCADLRCADLRCADLRGANLRGADLRGANLRHADLRHAELLVGATRSDGYQFMLVPSESGWKVQAGCRNFTLSEAKDHWGETRPVGESLGDETRLIIKHMLEIAALRKLSEFGK